MRKEFVYLDQTVDNEFEFNRLNPDGTDNVQIRNLTEPEFRADVERKEKELKRYNDLADQGKYTTILSQVIFVAVCQIGLATFVVMDMFNQQTAIQFPESYGFAVSKFVCGLLLHWLCQSRIR